MESYQRYGPALLRKAERVLQSREDARDVVQALFVDLLERGDDANANDLSYLYRAVTNRCLNVIRDRNNRTRLLARQDAVLRGPVRTSCEARAVDLDLLCKLASELDPESCEILVYRFVDDMGLEEIAQLTGKSRKTIGKRLDRVRNAVLRLSEPPAGAP
jgi:RNA polymerase sigma-70 factor (ECF subfamily)